MTEGRVPAARAGAAPLMTEERVAAAGRACARWWRRPAEAPISSAGCPARPPVAWRCREPSALGRRRAAQHFAARRRNGSGLRRCCLRRGRLNGRWARLLDSDLAAGRRVHRWQRQQPTELRGRVRDHLLGRAAVGLPGQGGRDTNARRHQEAGETARGSPAERGPVGRQRVIVQVGWAKRGVERRLGHARAGGKVGSRRGATPIRSNVREPGQSFFGVRPVLRRQQDDITIVVRIGLRWAQLGIHWATCYRTSTRLGAEHRPLRCDQSKAVGRRAEAIGSVAYRSSICFAMMPSRAMSATSWSNRRLSPVTPSVIDSEG
jgi:hypothetical protein